MRIPGARRLAALGLVVLVAAAGAQTPGTMAEPANGPRWWNRLFGSPPPPPAPKQAAGPGTMADRAAEQDKLMKAYLRRLDVCDRIRDVAHEANNPRLFEEASRLEEMAWKLYQSRSSRLLGVSIATADEEPLEPARPEPTTLEVLKAASPGGPLPPRLRSGGHLAPASADRKGGSGGDIR